MTGEMLLPEYEQEMSSTRTMLERVPEESFDWQPHEKSQTLLQLASHVAHVPSWTPMTLRTEELDLDGPVEWPKPTTRDEILAEFDKGVEEGREALAAASDEDFDVAWTLRTGDQVWFTLPRAVVYRSFVMNHMIHHRAQLGVYLRLLNQPVPGMYGPSADEQ